MSTCVAFAGLVNPADPAVFFPPHAKGHISTAHVSTFHSPLSKKWTISKSQGFQPISTVSHDHS